MAYTHYLPKWLLRQFRPEKPWELDIHTGRIDDRGLKKAGSGQDLWPADIEADMTKHDTRSAEIYYTKIMGRQRIRMNKTERWEFATWLALFAPRVPNTYQDIQKMATEAKEDPSQLVNLIREHRLDVLQRIHEKQPDLYRQAIDELGKVDGEDMLLTALAVRLLATQNYVPDPQTTWHLHIKTASIARFAHLLCQYHWTWFYSPHGYVIGDNPLLRWHVRKRRWNFGISRSGVEITFPLSAHLCLRMEQTHRHDHGTVMYCPRAMSHDYNRRQRLAAIAYVYSGSRKLLEPWRLLVQRRDF